MSFDALAPHYRWMEWLLAGDKLQRCRTAFLPRLADARRALILGEGNGRFLGALLQANPSLEVLCVDASARMLECARTRLQRAGLRLDQVEFVHADVTAWCPPRDGFDVLATHFFLDCFPADLLERIVGRLAAAVKPDARWLLADFCAPPAGLLRWRARIILWLMYRFFRVATRLPARSLTPPDAFLRRHGFELESRLLADWGLLHSDLWRRVRATG